MVPPCVAATIYRDIGEKIRVTTVGQPGPRAFPDNLLCVPEGLRSEVPEWGLSSRVTCHPGTQQVISNRGFGGRPKTTSRILSRHVRSANCVNNPVRLQQDSFNNCQIPVGPGPDPVTFSTDPTMHIFFCRCFSFFIALKIFLHCF